MEPEQLDLASANTLELPISNLQVNKDRDSKLTDFGKAKLITDEDGKEIFRFRHTYDLSTSEANNYELVATVLEAHESRQNITEEMI